VGYLLVINLDYMFVLRLANDDVTRTGWSPRCTKTRTDCRCVFSSIRRIGRAFPVAGPTIWNSLPDNVISAPSLSTFRQRLKTFLFRYSFHDIIADPR